jgi:hypothetical protein
LQELETETSIPLVAAIAFFGGDKHLNAKLLAKEFDVDCTEQTGFLHQMWDAIDAC